MGRLKWRTKPETRPPLKTMCTPSIRGTGALMFWARKTSSVAPAFTPSWVAVTSNESIPGLAAPATIGIVTGSDVTPGGKVIVSSTGWYCTPGFAEGTEVGGCSAPTRWWALPAAPSRPEWRGWGSGRSRPRPGSSGMGCSSEWST